MTQTYDLVCIQCGTPLATGLRTGKVAEADGRRLTQALLRGCAVCAESGIKSNFTVKLDLSPLRADARRGVDALADRSAPGVWRWHRLLPAAPRFRVSLGEGNTPLVPLKRFGRRMGVPNLYVKDESRNPTWSYKDRLCAVGVSNALEFGAAVITVSSTGNHGAAAAAYAARAGLPCVVFTLDSTPDVMKTLMQAYGAYVVAMERPRDRWRLMGEMAEEQGWYAISGFQIPPIGSNPFGIEGYKTIAFETLADLGAAPDWMVVPTAHGDGLTGVWKGWQELHELGLAPAPPKMAAAELNPSLEPALLNGEPAPRPGHEGQGRAAGAAGAARAAGAAGAAGAAATAATAGQLQDGGSAPASDAEPAAPDSPAFSIDVAIGTQQALAVLRRSGGRAVHVRSVDLIDLQRRLAEDEGIYAEASSLAGLAAVRRLAEEGALGADDVVVAVLTSTGLKDPGATAARLPAVPLIELDAGQLLDTLASVYGARFDT